MAASFSLRDWIAHVFDHLIADPAWYWEIDAESWEGSPTQIATYIAETFEDSGHLLAPFTDTQLNQGFWYLVGGGCSDFMRSLVESEVPLALRLRALRSILPLFEQVMAVRCSEHLSHLDESGANPLNGACYMWWDILPIHGCPKDAERIEFDAEVLLLLRRLLAIPHDACRESALHGIGEWACYYPAVAAIADDFLAQTAGLRPELISYAQSARVGAIQ